MFAASKSGRSAGGGGGVATDSSFAYVPLLLNTGTTNGQQNNTFLDSSTNNFTIAGTGTPTQGSFTPYWPAGQWSNYFSGSVDYLTVGTAAADHLGSGNFTFEAWVYRITSANGTVAGKWQSSVGFVGWILSNVWTWTGSSGTVTLTGTTNIPLYTWTHLVVCRSGNNWGLFVNGIREATTTSATAPANNGGIPLQIGTFESGNSVFPGYISNLRIVKGTSVYDPTLATLTVPTTPLTSIANTDLLACQSNSFKDNSTNNFAITRNGSPRIQPFSPVFSASYTAAAYGGSGYFSGSGDYLSVGPAAADHLGSGNFTFEAWVYRINTNNNTVVGKWNGGSGFVGWILSNVWTWTGSGSTVSLTGTSNIPLFLWTHLVVCRSGNNWGLFVNGIREAATTSATAPANNGSIALQIGTFENGNSVFGGYISNLRIVKGTSVYDPTLTTLTVPTAPVTAIANTDLLANFTNAGIYNATTQNNLFTVGSSQASTTITAKWPPTSMKFNGSGDWLTTLDHPQLQLDTGNFTIEGWFYLSLNNTAYGIVSKGTASTGWSVNVTSGNRIQFSYTASNLTGATTTLAQGSWYYFAVVRSGSGVGNLKIYINGTLEATSGGAVTDNFNQTDILYVGASRTGTTPLNGYLQDIRLTKGVARTVTTTPTAAFPTR